MEFIVRILFTGMMVFIPNDNGTQLDVVLLNVPHAHQISDSTALPHHKPLVLVRAGGCSGTCPTTNTAIASYAFGDLSTSAANDALSAAITANGGAWELADSQVTIAKGSTNDPDLPALDILTGTRDGIIPASASEREDYAWLADLDQICPSCGINEDVLATEPPSSLVAARFRLQTGDVFTYSVARVGSNVTPVHFKRLDGTGSASSYTQAIATVIGVDIAVSADSIKLVDTKFDGSSSRTMTLTPDENDRVEIAVLNLPPIVPAKPDATPGIGKHFERYYDLTDTPPAASARLVPLPGAAPGAPSYSTVTWSSIHPAQDLWSALLPAMRLDVSRSAADVTLCPPGGQNWP